MIRNYLKIAIRNLQRYKVFSFINVFGLALGTACCLYILLYVKDEYSYDEHHANAERIYRITAVLGAVDDPHLMATCSPPIPFAMKRDFPEIEEAVRFVGAVGRDQQLFRYDGKAFYETGGAYADSTFFNIFSYDFVYGSSNQALTAPFSIVLSEPTAKKFFGNIDPVGKVLEIDTDEGRQNLTVTGVVSDKLGKSHVQANYFLSMNSSGIGNYVLSNDEWVGNNFTNAYIKLRPNTSVSNLEGKLPAFLEKYAAERLRLSGMKKSLTLQPITSIHTTTIYNAEPSKPVSTTLLSVLLAIAVLIQIIACINFMNLSTARAAKRAREIGIRKVVGAARQSLVGQFLSESLIIAFLAMAVAVPLVIGVLPYLNQMTGVELSAEFLKDTQVWLGILTLGLITGLLAGSYPAFYLSGFQPLNVLKSKIINLGGNLNLRQALVVFQFMLAIGLIISVVIINSQLKFIQQKDLGYDPNQKIVVPFRTSEALQSANSYRDAIRQIPGVQVVSRANNYPSQFVFNDMHFYKQGADMNAAHGIQFMRVDEFFLKTLDINLLKGRDFNPTDTISRVIVNEATLQTLGIEADQAVGQYLYSDREEGRIGWEIVGVMKNFNFNSLYSEVTPFLFVYSNDAYNPQMIIKAETEDYAKFISQLETTWKSQVSAVPFEYTFIDQEVQQQYEADRRLSRIINSFTFLTILISCLGLFGLAMFTAEQRTKEIGIRKVLGAGVSNIITLISKDFIKLVIIALLIASPIAWWGMNKWLGDFAYRVDIQWWMFALAGVAAIAVALITVSFQAIKAALANPVNSLKSE
ncbi:MAG: ABC transporter permease [Saprospiraceae bacterium]|nr:ABC transporter permease [Saprospiraceae bacterium]